MQHPKNTVRSFARVSAAGKCEPGCIQHSNEIGKRQARAQWGHEIGVHGHGLPVIGSAITVKWYIQSISSVCKSKSGKRQSTKDASTD